MDRTGKTTLMKKVWELRGRVDCCVDRYIVSNIVFNEFYSRKTAKNNLEYLDFIKDDENTEIVYVTTTYSDYKERALKTNHEILEYDLWDCLNSLFDKMIIKLETEWFNHIKIIKIFNSNNNLDILEQKIVNEIGD
jgi:hypothetical protein